MMDVNLLVCVNAFALFRVLCGRFVLPDENFYFIVTVTPNTKLKAQGVNVKLGVSFPAKPPGGML